MSEVLLEFVCTLAEEHSANPGGIRTGGPQQAVFMYQESFTMFLFLMACVSVLVKMCSDFVLGGGKHRAASVRAVVQAGVAVMGHVGLLPQSISVLGGFRPQGQSAASALQVMEDALVSSHMLFDMSTH